MKEHMKGWYTNKVCPYVLRKLSVALEDASVSENL